MTSDPLVLLLTGFVLTTVLGGGLTYVFQQSSWRHQYRVQREDLRRDQAMRTFEEVSKLLDQRLYRMRQVYWAAKAIAKGRGDRARLDTAVQAYRAVLTDWNDNLNRVRALVHTYFGEEARQILEHRLHEEYVAIGEELDQFVREVSSAPDVPVRPIGARLTQLSHRVYTFDVHILAKARDATTPAPPADLGESELVRFGDKGQRVRDLQQALGTEVDGRFGRRTEKAVRAFQEQAGLPVDGIAGPGTLAALTSRQHGTG
jgi:murein L,D-transpeptidase YcbB/YkuD